jgi:hypothetical protein
MRWSWRASFLPVALDALLEGSLVGVPYLALALDSSGSGAPLALIEFWLAAAAGLVAARWHPKRLARINSVRVLAILAGVAGWLADPAARDALVAMRDPLAALPMHPAGWLLGIAVLRGAAHAKQKDERENATQAITIAFPVLALSLLLHLGAGGAFAVSAFVGSAVCVSAGLLAIGRARMQELEALGSVARGGRTWPTLAAAVVVLAALAIPIAILVGLSARDSAMATLGPLQGAVSALLGWLGGVLGWLDSLLKQFLEAFFPGTAPGATPQLSPSAAASHALPEPKAEGLSLPSLSALVWLVRIGIVVLVVLLVIQLRRLLPSPRATAPLIAPKEERFRQPRRPRFGLSLPRPRFLPHIGPRRRPTTAAQAYVDLLDELAEQGELGRKPDETPRTHAGRAADLGLPSLPLGLLAADYELAVYGRAAISESETKRALGRWRRLRKLAQRLPRPKKEA